MKTPARLSIARDPSPSLHDRAAEDLRFIRATMERAVAFTALPGWGGVLMGGVGFGAAAIASTAGTHASWLATWLCAAVLGFAIGSTDSVRTSRATATAGVSTSAIRFALALLPAFFAAACLTWAAARAGRHDELPALWLLLYGAGVLAASPFTIRAVRWVGLLFLALGVAALASARWGDAWLAAGFGGVHVAFGLWIARHRDG